MIRILFVDDDNFILAALRRMLHRRGKEWSCDYANNGEDALQLAEANDYDVIVSDIRMPGIDGAELLAAIQKRSPGTMRVTLSGQAEKDQIMRVMTSAHQILSKPCSPDRLCDTLSRLNALCQNLPSSEIKSVITSVGSLPSHPKIYDDLAQSMRSGPIQVEALSCLISQDPAMSAKVMQIANSFFADASRRIASPTQAIERLGGEYIKGMFNTAGVFYPMDTHATGDCRHAMERITARRLDLLKYTDEVASLLAVDPQVADDARTTCTLCAIGELAIAAVLPDTAHEILELETEGTLPAQAESEILGATYNTIGGSLLSLWNLPETIVDSVANHETPGKSKDKELSALTVVHIASVLLAERTSIETGLVASSKFDHEYLDALEIGELLPAFQTLAEASTDGGLFSTTLHMTV